MAKKHKGHHHTGKIRHHDMTSLPVGMGSKDPHGDPAYHKANAAHDLHHGMAPGGMHPEPNVGGSMQSGGEDMGGEGNAECYE